MPAPPTSPTSPTSPSAPNGNVLLPNGDEEFPDGSMLSPSGYISNGRGKPSGLQYSYDSRIGTSAAPYVAPNAPSVPSYLPREDAELLKMTLAAGSNPTEQQFWEAVDWIMKNHSSGASELAMLGKIMVLRQMNRGSYDNQLLACLDHYYDANVRSGENGYAMFSVVVWVNILAGWKAVGLPIPRAFRDSDAPEQPGSLLQYKAGLWGASGM